MLTHEEVYLNTFEILQEIFFKNNTNPKLADDEWEKLANYFKRYATDIQTNGLISTLLFIYSKANLKEIDENYDTKTVDDILSKKSSQTGRNLSSSSKYEIGDKSGALLVGNFFRRIIVKDGRLRKSYEKLKTGAKGELNGLELLKKLTENTKVLAIFEMRLKTYFKYMAQLLEAKPEI